MAEEREWYEKDLNDFDEPSAADEVELSHLRLKTQTIPLIQRRFNGNVYPIDLWYLIAMYLAPEDVGRFALICRDTNQIVNTIPFWIRLFRRFNKREANRVGRLLMKEQLSVVRTYVVRSLYQVYPLFQNRVKKLDEKEADPHFLCSSRCVRFWHRQRVPMVERFDHFFEFRFDTIDSISTQPNSLALRNEGQYKIEPNTYVLHVVSPGSVTMGPYMGMFLSQIALTMDNDYHYRKLKMTLDSSRSNVKDLPLVRLSH